jgi:hypothetical protein
MIGPVGNNAPEKKGDILNCICGYQTIKSLANLKSAGCRNCRRARRVGGRTQRKEIKGQRFKKFVVLECLDFPILRNSKYECLCDCGNRFPAN